MTDEYKQILMTLQEMKDQLHTIEDDIVALKQDFDEIYFSGDEDEDEDEKGEEEEPARPDTGVEPEGIAGIPQVGSAARR